MDGMQHVRFIMCPYHPNMSTYVLGSLHVMCTHSNDVPSSLLLKLLNCLLISVALSIQIDHEKMQVPNQFSIVSRFRVPVLW